MTQVTVKELAQVVDTPVERLLQQAGYRVTAFRDGHEAVAAVAVPVNTMPSAKGCLYI